MITKITGRLTGLADEQATISVPPFEYEVLVPEFTRRQIQLETGKEISLYTVEFIDGNVARGGRLTPRLVGFNSEIEREFFELFCSVDGVGIKKALRAMVRAVQELARAIEQQDVKSVSTLPGIGASTAERIIAKLRRKMPKFALMVPRTDHAGQEVERDVVEETFQVLCSLGHSESDARQLIDTALQSKKKFKDVESFLQQVYQQSSSEDRG